MRWLLALAGSALAAGPTPAPAPVVVQAPVVMQAPAPAPVLLPDTALCLQNLRAGEKERARAALGPLEALPLYRVEVDVDPLARTVSGKMELLHWVGNEPVRELFLQMTPNAQEPHRVRLSSVNVNGQPAHVQELEPSLVRIPVEPPAPPGSLLRLGAVFRAQVPPIVDNVMGGLSTGGDKRDRTDYGAFGATDAAMSLVGLIPRAPPLKPNGAPRDGPSGLGDLALYDPAHLLLTVKVPRGYEAWATGNALGEVPTGSGSVRYTYAAAAVRDFPLYVTHGYETQEHRMGDVTLSIHYDPEHADAAGRVLEYAASSIVEMERRLGKLAYTRFRVIEAPLQAGAGGMEFPGLISVSGHLMSGGLGMLDGMGIPPDLLPGVKDLLAATSSLQNVVENVLEFTVAHEVAHQYFAELVGNDPITEPAVDETLAQYTALLYLEWRYGKAAADGMRNGQVVASYHLFRMMGGEDGTVDRPTSAFSSGLEYAALVYGKGPLLHEAERKLLGDAAFLKGLRHYVDEYRFRWACRDCLTRVLARESPGHAAELHRLRKHWWLEKHGDDDLGTLDSMAGALQGQAVDPGVRDMADQMQHLFEP